MYLACALPSWFVLHLPPWEHMPCVVWLCFLNGSVCDDSSSAAAMFALLFRRHQEHQTVHQAEGVDQIMMWCATPTMSCCHMNSCMVSLAGVDQGRVMVLHTPHRMMMMMMMMMIMNGLHLSSRQG